MVVVYQRKGYDVLGNREYIKRMEKINLSAFIIGKLEVMQMEDNTMIDAINYVST